jgi:hypothetical protein
MKTRTIRIMLSKGWYHIVYAFSFMLFSILCSCSSSKAVSKHKTVDASEVEVPDASEVEIPSADEVSPIRIDDIEFLGQKNPDIRLMYGVQVPPSAR